MLAGIACFSAERPAAIRASNAAMKLKDVSLTPRVARPPVEPSSQPMDEGIYQERQGRREQSDGINLVTTVILHGVVDDIAQPGGGDHPFRRDRHDDRARTGDLLC